MCWTLLSSTVTLAFLSRLRSVEGWSYCWNTHSSSPSWKRRHWSPSALPISSMWCWRGISTKLGMDAIHHQGLQGLPNYLGDLSLGAQDSTSTTAGLKTRFKKSSKLSFHHLMISCWGQQNSISTVNSVGGVLLPPEFSYSFPELLWGWLKLKLDGLTALLPHEFLPQHLPKLHSA